MSSPHASSWSLTVQSPGLGLHLDAEKMQLAIKWWLGIDTSSGSKCALCPHNILDLLVPHAVTCKFSSDVVSRYNRLRDTFVQSCHFAGLKAKIEVGSGLSHDHQRTRPGDVLLPNWICLQSAALDSTVVSPLA